MLALSSKNNSLIKTVKGLNERKNRRASGWYILEGEKFIRDASEEGQKAEYLISVSEEMLTRYSAVSTVLVTEAIYSYISDEKSPCGIMGVYNIPMYSLEEFYPMKRVLCLDAVQQPDNVGALVRSAACAGYDGMMLLSKSADAYSPKAVRASAGLGRKIKILETGVEAVAALKEKGFVVYGADAKGKEKQDMFPEKTLLIIGNEGNGLSFGVKSCCNELIRIPIAAGCESLNAAVAGAILMYKTIGY